MNGWDRGDPNSNADPRPASTIAAGRTPISRFDLNLLGVFDAIYTCGGVSGAARHLHLSQPAISHSLARLREALGDQLFLRHANRLVPTAAAKTMIQPIRDALRRIDVTLFGATSFDPAASTRTFTIGLRPSSEPLVFAGLVARLMTEGPATCVMSRYFTRSSLNRALAMGKLDLALDIDRPKATGLRSHAIQSDSRIVIARANHPAIGDSLSVKDYLSLDHVFVSPSPAGLGREDAALAAMGRERRIKVRCQSVLTARQIVGGSDMICTLPSRNVTALVGEGPLRSFPLPFAHEQDDLRIYWHEATEADPGLAWLRDVAIAHFDR